MATPGSGGARAGRPDTKSAKDPKREREEGRTESPTGGPSQTSDGRPLDRDPTEEGSAGRDRTR